MLEGEEKLIREAKEGKKEAFAKLYDHYVAPIYRFIYLKVSGREEVEDLTHEVFLNAWQNLHGYRFRGFPFSSWLYQITRNRIIDYYRTRRNHVRLENIDPESVKISNPIELVLDQEFNLERVLVAIKQLNSDQQDVLIMRFVEDLSHQEIAQILGKSDGAVRLIQHRAINELKKILDTNETRY